MKPPPYKPNLLAPGKFGAHPLPDLFFVSWLGMIPHQIDCHVFVLRGQSGLLLIDCGTPWGHDRILENLAHWGLAASDVRTILLTHGHVDHVSGGYHFKKLGAEILCHREIVVLVESQWEATGTLNDQGQSWRIDGTLADGDRLSRCGFDIRVVHTPGHTRGCLSFLIDVNNQSCLFSGDLVMHDGRPGWRGEPDYSANNIVASLNRLQREKFQHLAFGHGYLPDDGGRLFRHALARHASGDWDAPGTPGTAPVPGRTAPPGSRL